MTRHRVAVVWFVALVSLPSAARAALSLQLGESYGPLSIDPIRVSPEGLNYFDIRFNETGTVNREGLFAYDIALRVERPAGVTRGLRLLTGESAVAVPPRIPADDFVLPAVPPPQLMILESDPNHLTFDVLTLTESDFPDIDQGERAARIFWTWEPFAPEGIYRIVVDPEITVFASGEPELPLRIEVETTDAFVVFFPEPGAVSLLAIAAPFALRRWRGKSRPRTNTILHR